MSDSDSGPGLVQIVGALLYAAPAPLSVDEIRRVLKRTAQEREIPDVDVPAWARAGAKEIGAALEELRGRLRDAGMDLREVAGGFRIENDVACSPWLRVLLDRKPAGNRLSKPALETLAIIAYRQPCTRAEVEQVRGVAVDQVVRRLMELDLVRVAGRSDLPGRPWLFATTTRFLEYFGLRRIDDLPAVEELRRQGPPPSRATRQKQAEAAEADDSPTPADKDDAPPSEAFDESESDGSDGSDASEPAAPTDDDSPEDEEEEVYDEEDEEEDEDEFEEDDEEDDEER